MADDIQLNSTSGGATIRTDEIGGKHYQVLKAAFGLDGVADMVSREEGLPVSPAASPQSRFLSKFLSTDNTGGMATSEAAIDGGTTDQELYLQPTSSGQKLLVTSLRLTALADSFYPETFAAMSSSLSGGLHLYLTSNSVLVSDLFSGHGIKTSEDFFKHGKVSVEVLGSKEVLTLEVDLPTPILLDGDNTDERIALMVTDDMTVAGLDSLMILAKALKL